MYLHKFNKLFKQIILENKFQDQWEESHYGSDPQLKLNVVIEEVPIHLNSLPGDEQLIDVNDMTFQIYTDRTKSGHNYNLGILNTPEKITRDMIKISYKENNNWIPVDFLDLTKQDQIDVIIAIENYLRDPDNFENDYLNKLDELSEQQKNQKDYY